MAGGLDIKQEKSRVTAFVNAGAVLFVTYLIFWGLSGVCFGIVELAGRLELPEYEDVFSCDWAKFFYHPVYVFELYGEWWERLIRSIRLMDVRLVLLAPFSVPAAIVATVVLALAGRNYSFHLRHTFWDNGRRLEYMYYDTYLQYNCFSCFSQEIPKKRKKQEVR